MPGQIVEKRREIAMASMKKTNCYLLQIWGLLMKKKGRILVRKDNLPLWHVRQYVHLFKSTYRVIVFKVKQASPLNAWEFFFGLFIFLRDVISVGI